MPKNFKDKKFDRRPYVDKQGWIVITRKGDCVKFMQVGRHVNHQKMFSNHRIDKYAMAKMEEQFHAIQKKLLKEAGYVKT